MFELDGRKIEPIFEFGFCNISEFVVLYLQSMLNNPWKVNNLVQDILEDSQRFKSKSKIFNSTSWITKRLKEIYKFHMLRFPSTSDRIQEEENLLSSLGQDWEICYNPEYSDFLENSTLKKLINYKTRHSDIKYYNISICVVFRTVLCRVFLLKV